MKIFRLLMSCFIPFLMYSIGLFAVPLVTNISPSVGPTVGGNVVYLTGSGFTGAGAVRFGTTPAINFFVNSDSSIIAIAPPMSPGNTPITVTTSTGTSLATFADFYTYQGVWFAYVANSSSNNATPINLANNTPGTPIPVGSSPIGVAITPDGKTAYVVNNLSNNVTPIDTATNIAGAPIPVGILPAAVTINAAGTIAYVTDNSSNTVTPINIATNTPGAPIPAGPGPLDIAINPAGTVAYVTNPFSSFITPINLLTQTPGAPIPTGIFPSSIAITPDGLTAYVVNTLSNNVTPINLTTNTPDTPIPTGNFPAAIAITPDGTKAYVINNGSNSLTIINIPTNTVSATITLGFSPVRIAITPDGATAYITSGMTNSVFPLDLATHAIGLPIPVGTAPRYIAITPDQAPFASFIASNAINGNPTFFDATNSRSPVGTIVSYNWNFGDGQTIVTSSPTISHTYTAPGEYLVTLTVVNSAGTSTIKISTGHTLNRNGGPTAVFMQEVTVSPILPPPPPVPLAPLPPTHFKGRVVKNEFATQTEYIHHLKWKPSADPTVVSYQLFRNGDLIAVISNQGPFNFEDHNRKKNKVDEYTLVALNAAGQASAPLIVRVPHQLKLPFGNKEDFN